MGNPRPLTPGEPGGPAAQVAKHEDVDSSDEPLRRIHGFWQTFHRGTRKGDPRPVTPVAQQKATETFLLDWGGGSPV